MASRLRAAGLWGRTVTLKVRFGDFVTITRSQTLPDGLNNGPAIAAVGTALLAQVDVTVGVRLLGLSVAGLSRGATRQLSLDLNREGPSGDGANGGNGPHGAGPRGGPGNEPAWVDATRAIDRIRHRFGSGAVGPAALLGDGGLSVKRPGDSPWGPDE